MIKGVCKDCPDRRVTRDYNCHSHCERYAEEKRQRAEAKAKEDDDKSVTIEEIGRYLAIKDVKTKVRKRTVLMPAKDKNSYTVSSKAACPHYRGHAARPRAIKCDGLFNNNPQRLTFGDQDEYKSVLKCYCFSGWQKCPYNRSR